MSLIPFKDFWTEFAEKFSTVCPEVPATQLKPIFEELEASIERRINQAVDEAAAKEAEKLRQRKLSTDIAHKRRWSQVYGAGSFTTLDDVKRLKKFWKKADKILGFTSEDIQLVPPQKQWETINEDPDVGETLVGPTLKAYQYKLVFNEEHFRPIGPTMSNILQHYKKVATKTSTKDFFEIYKLSPDPNHAVLDLATILQKQHSLSKLLKLAANLSPADVCALNEALEFERTL